MKRFDSICAVGIALLLCISWATCSVLIESVTDQELAGLSEQLYSLEVDNNANKHINVNIQGNASSTSDQDWAANVLLTVDSKSLSLPTIQTLGALHDNYNADMNVQENYGIGDQAEIDSFIDVIFETSVMKKAQEFLKSKNLPNGRDTFYDMWFGLYKRGAEHSSCGFEHVFLGELKKKEVSGLHNWVFFNREELNNFMDYLGYMRFSCLGTKGSLIELTFKWRDARKPISSMFIGTSPELELALYTVCFHSRPNATCPISLAGKALLIQTFGKGTSGQFVATSYPVFPDGVASENDGDNCKGSGSGKISTTGMLLQVFAVFYLAFLHFKWNVSIIY